MNNHKQRFLNNYLALEKGMQYRFECLHLYYSISVKEMGLEEFFSVISVRNKYSNLLFYTS